MDKKKIKEIISQMTLKEKAGLCSGKTFWLTKDVERLGIPEMMVADGPHGLRKQADKSDHLGINKSIEATCFPTGVGVAASFDRELARKLGEILGYEAAAEDLGVVLGPAINIKRSPLCGRNFEYLSEDPYLTGEIATSYTQGLQSKGVGVSVKHFAVNSQEKFRMTISEEVDERTMREIYFPGFENTVKKADPWTIMCAYNKINGEYCSQNKWLLTDVLRKDWGFKGFVVSDWGAVLNRVEALEAGLELEMPTSGGRNDIKIVEAVESGKLDEKVLDLACERLLTIVFRSLEKHSRTDIPVYDRDLDHKKARAMATETMVLLKNEGDILPLDKKKKYAFIGQFAKVPRYQGGGSSHINTSRVVGAWDAASDIDKVFAKGYRDDSKEDEKLIKEAVEIAKTVDIPIIFAGLPPYYESEGFDRTHMDMPPVHNALISAVAAVNKNTVVVLHNGSPVTMPWVDEVPVILEAYLGGEAVGEATVDILFGDANPSAKLSETFPIALKDVASSAYYPGYTRVVEHREGLYVGYRYFDKKNLDVLFPFGHGLSYTKFEYSDLKLSSEKLDGDYSLTVKFKVKNVGDREGKEVVQLYVKDIESTVYRPEKELKGFEKVSLKPGEETFVEIGLDKRSFAFYNVLVSDWQVESGDFEILVGASSRDIRLSGQVSVVGDATEMTDDKKLIPSYYSGDVEDISDKEFAMLLGRDELSPRDYEEGYKVTKYNDLFDTQHTKWGKRICKIVVKAAGGVSKDDLGSEDMSGKMALQTPIEAMVNFAGGVLTNKSMNALIDFINGDKPFRAVMRLLGALIISPFTIRKFRKNELFK